MTFWDSNPEDPMPKANGQQSRWVQKEAAMHTTPDSIRQRIAYEEKQIRALANVGSGQPVEKARKDHFDLIRVLSERLARAENQSP
ncbi:hypothetical protein [Microvirga aerophila]|uniref:hypothetical protein n=1 Tax=Microvirga aerophila TaxID=670291 RepID=UPI0011BE0843|nr:hypothetical protein [Microvirga aerophila]